MSLDKDKSLTLVNSVIKVTKIDSYRFSRDLCEYFSYNVKDFISYISNYKVLEREDSVSRLCIFDFNKDNYPCELIINRDTGDFYYVLKDGVNPFDIKDVSIFDFSEEKKPFIKRRHLNNTGLFVEDYYHKEKIQTTLYGIEGIEDAVTFSLKNNINCLPIDNIVCIITVEVTGDQSYRITIRNKDNELLEPAVEIEGNSLYSAYYDFMITKGYFSNNDNAKHKKYGTFEEKQ